MIYTELALRTRSRLESRNIGLTDANPFARSRQLLRDFTMYDRITMQDRRCV